MKIFIRIAGIILGLIEIYGGLWLLTYVAWHMWGSWAYSIWHEIHHYPVVGPMGTTVGALLLFFIAALLLAPGRIYQRSPVRAIGLVIGKALVVIGVLGAVTGVFYWLAVGAADENIVLATAFMAGVSGILALASAAVLFARVSIAGRSSREQISRG
jgi:hypothetical protein